MTPSDTTEAPIEQNKEGETLLLVPNVPFKVQNVSGKIDNFPEVFG